MNDLDGPPDSLLKAVKRAFVSVGTIAIGALMIALATILRIAIGWATYLAKQYNIEDIHWSIKWLLYIVNFLGWLCEQMCQQFSKYG